MPLISPSPTQFPCDHPQVDFNSLSWHTIFLVGGGNVLGKAVSSSGLLGYISAGITEGEWFRCRFFTISWHGFINLYRLYLQHCRWVSRGWRW